LLKISLDGGINGVINLPFKRGKFELLDDHLKIYSNQNEQNISAIKQCLTSLGGNSTILFPSWSLIVFSRLKRILSRITWTTSIALGSRLRNGIVINL